MIRLDVVAYMPSRSGALHPRARTGLLNSHTITHRARVPDGNARRRPATTFRRSV